MVAKRPQTTTMTAKEQKIANLLRGHHSVMKIADIVYCSVELVRKVRRLINSGKCLSRLTVGGRYKRIATEHFLISVSFEIEASPTTHEKVFANNFNIRKGTIRNAVKKLGAYSYVYGKRQIHNNSSLVQG
uniref:Uncharacterized protein n=1 Tax=Lepeophtheirus salmonis TaxID=72036 RepID=A0A0K2ULH5_LEPSM